MVEDAERIVDLYQRHAAAWDRARGRNLMERSWLDRFTGLLPPGGIVLDVGCGSGAPIAGHLAECGFVVTGIDSAPAMIAMCTARFPSARWIVADMRKLALGQRFDGLVAWDSFFHLTPDDQRAMFPAFAAHAAPGAALMFTSGPSQGVAMGTFEGEPLYHASLAPEEYRALLGANGFEVVAYVAQDPGCGGHTVWLAIGALEQRN